MFRSTDVVVLGNRAASGTVEIRANNAAGSGGESTVATYAYNKIDLEQNTEVTTGNTLTLPSAGLIVGASTPFSDAAGTLTLQNVDAIDATTRNTIATALQSENTPLMVWTYDYAGDAAAADTFAEYPIGGIAMTTDSFVITDINLVPQSSLTADNTNYATITIATRNSSGGVPQDQAEVTTEITGSGDWGAFDKIALTVSDTTVNNNRGFTIEIAKAGTGVQLPPFCLTITGYGTT
jgi:hypothetical protein